MEDAFCFCTPGQKAYYPFTDFGREPSDSLKNFINQQNQPFRPTLYILDCPSMLVPALLFETKKINAYWEPYGKIPETHEPRVFTSSNGLVKMIYPYPTKLSESLTKITDKFSIIPGYAYLYDRIAEHAKNDFSKQIYVHLMKGCFDLFVMQGTRIILANRYPQKNEEDFMYYLFYVSEQLQLSSQNSKLNFLGQFNHYHAYYESVRNFQEELHFLDTDRNSPMGNLDPTPYWYA